MILSILFDFGGTLDADGLHWLDRFYRIYEQVGFGQLPKDRIKEAFYWADAQAEKDLIIRKSRWREMIHRHVHWQFEHLGLQKLDKEADVAEAFIHPAERVLRRNRNILETLSYAGLQLGIVSNSYGNLETLSNEFGYTPFLGVILDSANVGLRKPDPKIFELALQKLNRSPNQVIFVGDSFERDIVPAKSIGMKTYWLTGDTSKPCPNSALVDAVIRSLEDLPQQVDPLDRVPR